MRESIKVIKWCSTISILFLILTYAVSVNSEAHFVVANTRWVSNNFLITLFGGVFASMLVVVLCEIQKYRSTKENTEQFLFYQGLYLYQALMQMGTIIQDYRNHCEWQLPENLFDESVRMIQSEINALQMTDYATFQQKNNSLMFEHGKFRLESLPKIQPVLQSNIRLRLAINEAGIEHLQMQLDAHSYSGSYKRITSGIPRIADVLKAELERVDTSVVLVDHYLDAIDDCCHRKFNWDDIKKKLVFPHLDNMGNAKGHASSM